MIIYNVTIKVQITINEKWLQWMKDQHIPEVMRTGCFSSYRLCHLLEQDESEGKTYTVQYLAETQVDYDKYLKEHAGPLRDKSFKQFGNGFIAFRTLMEVWATG